VLKGILHETFGVICFQEQVLQIAQAIAGYSLGEADVLRKAMGKKIPEIMEQQKATFLAGATANDFDHELAEAIFEKIQPFAGYAFNKAHAVSYALLCYRTAWLKYHYPVEYFCALLNSNSNDREKVANYIAEAKRMGIRVAPPSVRDGFTAFVGGETDIRFGLSAIKGVQSRALDIICSELNTDNLFQLCALLKKEGGLNAGTITNLIRSGACDCFGDNRKRLESITARAVKYATTCAAEAKEERQPLFPPDYIFNWEDFPEVEDYSASEKFKMEVDLLGLCVNNGTILRELLQFAPPYCKEVAEITSAQADVRLAGAVIELRPYTTKAGKKMGYLKLEDTTGVIELTIFPKAWGELGKDFFSVGQAVSVTVDVKDDGEKLLAIVKSATEIVPPTECVYITVNSSNAQYMGTVEGWARAYPGIVPIIFLMESGVVVKSKYACALTPPFVNPITDLMGWTNVEVRPM
jgi:DNA polymerase-3 subunit alpha